MLSQRTARDEPDLPRLLHKARTAHVEGALAQAEKLYEKILKLDPDNFDALHLLGFLNHQSGRPAEALLFLAAALARNGRSAEAHSNHGLVLHELGRIEDALASYDNALAIDPGNVDLLNTYAAALLDFGQTEKALAVLDSVLARNPNHIEALGNRGNALLKLNRPAEAMTGYDAALGIRSDNAQLLTNRAHALRRLDRPADALPDLRKAVALDPGHAEAFFELGMTLLTLGEFGEGWAAYEQRWATAAFAPHRRTFRSPLWTGAQPLQDRTLLLHAEQGFGDTIQFIRYVPHLARLGATVVVEVQPELAELVSTVAGVARVIARGDKLVPFDLHCPLMSLPHACRTSVTTIPANVPYLKVPDSRAATWAKRLPQDKRTIGVVWAGRRAHHNDANRSIALRQFAALFGRTDIQFVSLQRDLNADDRALLRGHDNVIDIGDELGDFADTAALISRLDYVISVDTAVAHLAGALAKPVTVLLPFAADFRWLRARNDSPWYPTAKLYRQPRFGDWASVIEQVGRNLRPSRESP
jgi:hypothetical protein